MYFSYIWIHELFLNRLKVVLFNISLEFFDKNGCLQALRFINFGGIDDFGKLLCLFKVGWNLMNFDEDIIKYFMRLMEVY